MNHDATLLALEVSFSPAGHLPAASASVPSCLFVDYMVQFDKWTVAFVSVRADRSGKLPQSSTVCL